MKLRAYMTGVVAYFCPLLSLFDRKLFQETRNLDLTRPVTFVTMFKAWSDKVVRKRCFKRWAFYHFDCDVALM